VIMDNLRQRYGAHGFPSWCDARPPTGSRMRRRLTATSTIPISNGRFTSTPAVRCAQEAGAARWLAECVISDPLLPFAIGPATGGVRPSGNSSGRRVRVPLQRRKERSRLFEFHAIYKPKERQGAAPRPFGAYDRI